ncbi:FkbM family methyltransferase [Roseomonas stagni]|uniref:FkbM family methyltransferase n=1 Tax=Falsiroseomonas algicola TaxID=2716930 RepID=A0A6M1LPW6_9PROT|nr:FkbM family methyltransferase [Falsiroseomonas algicola]NGM21814.1 FkbM family methyltransferase [Falsiroseomonas algicola]
MSIDPVRATPAALPPARPPLFFQHVRRQMPDYAFRVIFDVGANIGQSCTAFAVAAPEAEVIHAFEPVASTFAVLAGNVAANPRIKPCHAALGATSGEAMMTARALSTNNRVIPARPGARNTESVTILTGDQFCAHHGIEAISYLKIDTEGHDLDVLKGFAGTLPRIDFVQVEASMNPYNTLHAPFRALEDLLRDAGFLLFQFYDQTFQNQLPVLRRANPVFIHSRFYEAAKALKDAQGA